MQAFPPPLSDGMLHGLGIVQWTSSDLQIIVQTQPKRAMEAYLVLFNLLCEHDDDRSLLFPHHQPEIAEGGWSGTLTGDVR